jgi:short-subunit dehydrogenase
MENPLGLSQTTVLITGSTDGVGKLIAKRSAVASPRVRERQRLRELALELTGQSAGITR